MTVIKSTPFCVSRKTVHKCSARGCKRKTRTAGTLFCDKHARRAWRYKNKAHAAYENLKRSAKRRGKDFKISLDEWKKFCIATGYHKEKGRSAAAMSIDRIDVTKGYSIENIRVITVSENSRKGATEDKAALVSALNEWDQQK